MGGCAFLRPFPSGSLHISGGTASMITGEVRPENIAGELPLVPQMVHHHGRSSGASPHGYWTRGGHKARNEVGPLRARLNAGSASRLVQRGRPAGASWH